MRRPRVTGAAVRTAVNAALAVATTVAYLG
jgi:hypothetical protein